MEKTWVSPIRRNANMTLMNDLETFFGSKGWWTYRFDQGLMDRLGTHEFSGFCAASSIYWCQLRMEGRNFIFDESPRQLLDRFIWPIRNNTHHYKGPDGSLSALLGRFEFGVQAKQPATAMLNRLDGDYIYDFVADNVGLHLVVLAPPIGSRNPIAGHAVAIESEGAGVGSYCRLFDPNFGQFEIPSNNFRTFLPNYFRMMHSWSMWTLYNRQAVLHLRVSR